jgi:thiamine-phosphate pyrophosphorylase
LSNRPEPRFAPPRLYAILDVDAARARGIEPIDLAVAWLDAGVTLVQLRAKALPLGPFVGLAAALGDLIGPRRATLIVNDRADVAALAGAHGVHVGQEDLTPAEARRLVGEDAIVGLSTHTPAQVAQALGERVDYLAIGPVFRTGTKASAWPEVGLDGVRAAAATVGRRLPLVAIGGITLETAPDVVAAGAASVAVVSDLLVGEPAARAIRWLAALA